MGMAGRRHIEEMGRRDDIILGWVDGAFHRQGLRALRFCATVT